ncbi:SCO family protein [Desertihabitans aurantiacus]|uniref:SCO family protein n=1 Tax=Desertihabitans aurantiacus TaxID=2282477 RepID=UPI000DF7E896|nr:SCO family protein [Desertihabitans aurantiacus]
MRPTPTWTAPGLLRAVVAVLVCGCLGLVGCQAGHGPEKGSHHYSARVLTEGYPVPSVTLTDTRGQAFDLQTSPSRPVTLYFFGYTSCPQHCSEVLSTVAEARQLLPDPDKVQVVVVSIDPERDTGERLAAYLDRFDPAFIGLRGELEVVRTAAEQLGVEIGPRHPVADGYEIAHGTQVVGADRDHRARLVWVEDVTAEQLAEDLEHFLEEQQ